MLERYDSEEEAAYHSTDNLCKRLDQNKRPPNVHFKHAGWACYLTAVIFVVWVTASLAHHYLTSSKSMPEPQPVGYGSHAAERELSSYMRHTIWAIGENLRKGEWLVIEKREDGLIHWRLGNDEVPSI